MNANGSKAALFGLALFASGCGDAAQPDPSAPPGDGGEAGEGPLGGEGNNGGGGQGAAGGDGGAGGDPEYGPTRYDHGAINSPFTDSVVGAIAAWPDAASSQPDVFMKVGASGTVNASFMKCFADPAALDWRGGPSYDDAVSYFLSGDAAGSNPFERETLAAVSGKSAGWAISGDPSPLDQEIAAIRPSVALVNYGTNDMGLGTTYRSALFPFYTNMVELITRLESEGIVPIITGLNPRADSAAAAHWVPTYDVVTRGLAETRQIPYISLYQANRDLPAMGLIGDGIHGNAFQPGGPCVFTAEALEYNYNLRNLLSIEALDGVRRVAQGESTGWDLPDASWSGEGTASDPWLIDSLPFTHAADSSNVGRAVINGYPSCDDSQDESGNEVFYRLTIERPTAVRMLVLDDAGVDIDLHLLAGSDPSDCIERGDRTIETTLAAGEYSIVLDTFASVASGPQAGPYLFAILVCESDDPDCSS